MPCAARLPAGILLEECAFKSDTNGSITIPLSSMTNFAHCQNVILVLSLWNMLDCVVLPPSGLLSMIFLLAHVFTVTSLSEMRWPLPFPTVNKLLPAWYVPELDMNLYCSISIPKPFFHNHSCIPNSHGYPFSYWTLLIVYTKHSVNHIWGQSFEALCMFVRCGGQFLNWGQMCVCYFLLWNLLWLWAAWLPLLVNPVQMFSLSMVKAFDKLPVDGFYTTGTTSNVSLGQISLVILILYVWLVSLCDVHV